MAAALFAGLSLAKSGGFQQGGSATASVREKPYKWPLRLQLRRKSWPASSRPFLSDPSIGLSMKSPTTSQFNPPVIRTIIAIQSNVLTR